MKKRKRDRVSTKRYGRVPVIGLILAIAFVAAGAATVISRQRASASGSRADILKAPVAAQRANSGGKYMTVRVAGRDVQVDPQTGQIRPLTPEEAQRLAEGLRTMLNTSTDGLVPVRRADGSMSMDLQGRFQNVSVARVNSDGSVTQSCIDSPKAAAAFFGIDPKLLGVEPTVGPAEPARLTPTRSLQ